MKIMPVHEDKYSTRRIYRYITGTHSTYTGLGKKYRAPTFHIYRTWSYEGKPMPEIQYAWFEPVCGHRSKYNYKDQRLPVYLIDAHGPTCSDCLAFAKKHNIYPHKETD